MLKIIQKNDFEVPLKQTCCIIFRNKNLFYTASKIFFYLGFRYLKDTAAIHYSLYTSSFFLE